MQTQTMDQAQATQIIATMLPMFAIFGLIAIAVIIVPLWVAFKKAGLAGPLALMVLIPFIGPLLTLYVLAFAKWKVVPAPEFGGYMPNAPVPVRFDQAYPQPPVPSVPPSAGYSAPGSYAPVASSTPSYPPVTNDPNVQR